MASEAQEREESADMSAGIYRKIDIPCLPPCLHGKGCEDNDPSVLAGEACQAGENEREIGGKLLGGVDREDSRDRRVENRNRKGVDAPPQQKVLQ